MSITLTVRTGDELYQALQRRAESLGKTVSELVREVLERPIAERTGHVKERLGLPQPADPLRKASQGPELAAVKSMFVATGPLVAYLDARDPAHDPVAACLADFSGQLHTTGAVITEAMHFLAAAVDGPALLAEFVTGGRIDVHDFSQPADLRVAAALMAKYSDTPIGTLRTRRWSCWLSASLSRISSRWTDAASPPIEPAIAEP